jgi:hypothetical protein
VGDRESGQPASRTALPLTSLMLISHWHPVVVLMIIFPGTGPR